MLGRGGLGLGLVLAAAAVLGGCGRGHGLPAELTDLLAGHGVAITPARVHAPRGSRGGYLVVPHVPETAAAVVTALELRRIQPDDRQWRWAIERAGGAAPVKEAWGVTGRPIQLRLKSGAQLEYLFLLVAEDGFMYLVSEFAYG